MASTTGKFRAAGKPPVRGNGKRPGRPAVRVTLREVRERRALSLSDLAGLAGVDRTTVHRIEQGHAPQPRTRRALAEALKVDVAAIAWPEGGRDA